MTHLERQSGKQYDSQRKRMSDQLRKGEILFFLLPALQILLEDTHCCRNHCDDDDGQNDDFEVFLNKWQSSEEISCQCKGYYPYKGTDDIIDGVFPPIHFSNTGHKRNKCPDDGQESSDYNRQCAIFCIECFSSVQVLSLYKWKFAGFNQFAAKGKTDIIVDSVAENSSDA